MIKSAPKANSPKRVLWGCGGGRYTSEQRHFTEHEHDQRAEDANGEEEHKRDDEALRCCHAEETSVGPTAGGDGSRSRLAIEFVWLLFIERHLG